MAIGRKSSSPGRTRCWGRAPARWARPGSACRAAACSHRAPRWRRTRPCPGLPPAPRAIVDDDPAGRGAVERCCAISRPHHVDGPRPGGEGDDQLDDCDWGRSRRLLRVRRRNARMRRGKRRNRHDGVSSGERCKKGFMRGFEFPERREFSREFFGKLARCGDFRAGVFATKRGCCGQVVRRARAKLARARAGN